MHLSELLQPFFLKRAAACLGIGFLLFASVWKLGGNRRGPLTLAALGGAWIACHLVMSILSVIFPPKEASDWLLAGSGAVVLVAGLFVFHQSNFKLMAVAAAVLLAVTLWLMLGKIPYLLAPNESLAERQQWTLLGIAAVLLVFASAEWLAHGLPAASVWKSMAVFAAAAGLSLWKLDSQSRMVMLPLALALMACGAALASLLLRSRAVIPPGLAGWFAGGIVVLFIRAALSRAESVPLVSVGVAVAAMPAAALLVSVWRRVRLGDSGLAAIGAVVMTSAGIFWSASAKQQHVQTQPAPSISTGADDTGAYEGL